MHARSAEAIRFRKLSSAVRRGRDKTYYVTTRTSATVVEGKLPLTAAEALAYVKRATGLAIEIRDAQQRTVSVEKLRKEASPER